MWHEIMSKIVRWLDPIFDKYREKRAEPKKVEAPKFVPKTMEDFVDVVRRTPKKVLDDTQRARIAAVMSFDDRSVSDIMKKKDEMVFVNEKDFLGPLMLDKLYKSGFTNFPVVDNAHHVKGIIHTEALNALEIKKTDRASKYMEKDVYYLHHKDSLERAVEEIERTNAYYFLVLDENDALAGFLTVQILLDYLLGI